MAFGVKPFCKISCRIYLHSYIWGEYFQWIILNTADCFLWNTAHKSYGRLSATQMMCLDRTQCNCWHQGLTCYTTTNQAKLSDTSWLFLPMSSVGVFSMKCSHSLMNISVVSAAGHSAWLNETQTHPYEGDRPQLACHTSGTQASYWSQTTVFSCEELRFTQKKTKILILSTKFFHSSFRGKRPHFVLNFITPMHSFISLEAYRALNSSSSVLTCV